MSSKEDAMLAAGLRRLADQVLAIADPVERARVANQLAVTTEDFADVARDLRDMAIRADRDRTDGRPLSIDELARRADINRSVIVDARRNRPGRRYREARALTYGSRRIPTDGDDFLVTSQ